ncbi:hypothetical protein NPIL_145011 [Nephila pilipes]|uniref:Uncharacterized protein n=1 Tax=Nephila pilipes TaxID=299642 RepID=A0A8X6ULF6_NEPPI|nr:hypothetical protein NPIL_145011 [Nephila pilipes]
MEGIRRLFISKSTNEFPSAIPSGMDTELSSSDRIEDAIVIDDPTIPPSSISLNMESNLGVSQSVSSSLGTFGDEVFTEHVVVRKAFYDWNFYPA